MDRSAAYAARYLAKNVVAAGLANRCTIQISYAIGVSDPLSVYVNLHGTGQVDEAKLEQMRVTVDQAGKQRRTAEIDDRGVRRRVNARFHFRNFIFLDQDSSRREHVAGSRIEEMRSSYERNLSW